MFERFGDIFRKHPLWIVGGVLALVVLIWLMMRGGSSSQMAVYSSGPTDAQVQGAYALQAAQITANAATAQAQLANEKTANDNATAVILNTQNTGAATTINAQNTGAATAINAQNVRGATTINAQNTEAATTINSQNATAAVQINQQNVTGATSIAQTQANAAVTMAGYSRDIEINGQNAHLQEQQILSSTQLQIQKLAEDTAKQTSILNMLGATNPKGGMASFVDSNGQLVTIGLNNRNPFGMPK